MAGTSLDRVSCFRRMWPPERRWHARGPRKGHGSHLVAQGPDPPPTALDAQEPYEMRLTVAGAGVAFSVDGLEGFRRRDEHPPPGGKTGSRRTAPPIGEHAGPRATSP
ncbi:DUF1961 family protein [Streptosporangium sp. NPDC023615]|uniref:DUF1961 family protein n=1 Tax=Streptosporangium sp. NPDC023615 TaxID=3154794 RepID=UPI0034220DA1